MQERTIPKQQMKVKPLIEKKKCNCQKLPPIPLTPFLQARTKIVF